MGDFLRHVALLAAVTAAGGVALSRASNSPARASAPSAPIVADHGWAPPAIHSPISFAALGAGELIVVRFASRGCFHDFEHDFVFAPAPTGGATLTLVRRRDNLAPDISIVAPSHLSLAELRELDAQLGYLRAPRMGGCTTSQQIDVTLYRGGDVVAKEHFVDASCGVRAPGTLTFGGLLRIVRPPRP